MNILMMENEDSSMLKTGDFGDQVKTRREATQARACICAKNVAFKLEMTIFDAKNSD